MILHMGDQIRLKIVCWNDFCHTKNLKIGGPPIIRCGLIHRRREMGKFELILSLYIK